MEPSNPRVAPARVKARRRGSNNVAPRPAHATGARPVPGSPVRASDPLSGDANAGARKKQRLPESRRWAFTLQTQCSVGSGCRGAPVEARGPPQGNDVGLYQEDQGGDQRGSHVEGEGPSPHLLLAEGDAYEESSEGPRQTEAEFRAEPAADRARGEGEGGPGSPPCGLNPSPKEIEEILQLKGKKIVYYVFQLEKAPATGQLHYQGYVRLSASVTLSYFRSVFGNLKPHLEICKGNEKQNIEYCTKDESRQGGPWEYGERANPGKRNDIADAVEAMRKEGIKSAIVQFTSVFVRYHRGMEFVRRQLEETPKMPNFVPRDWQQQVIDMVSEPADDRKVIWVVDTAGQSGKSYLSRYLQLEKDAVQLAGRMQDMSMLYDKEPIVVFDISRSAADYSDHLYSMAESLKNGIIIQTKYETCRKVFNPPHVLFFANKYPDPSKWTRDRYVVLCIKDGVLESINYEDLPCVDISDNVSSRSNNFRRSL